MFFFAINEISMLFFQKNALKDDFADDLIPLFITQINNTLRYSVKKLDMPYEFC